MKNSAISEAEETEEHDDGRRKRKMTFEKATRDPEEYIREMTSGASASREREIKTGIFWNRFFIVTETPEMWHKQPREILKYIYSQTNIFLSGKCSEIKGPYKLEDAGKTAKNRKKWKVGPQLKRDQIPDNHHSILLLVPSQFTSHLSEIEQQCFAETFG